MRPYITLASYAGFVLSVVADQAARVASATRVLDLAKEQLQRGKPVLTD